MSWPALATARLAPNQLPPPGTSGAKRAATSVSFTFAPSYTNATDPGNTTITTTTTTTTAKSSNGSTTKTTTTTQHRGGRSKSSHTFRSWVGNAVSVLGNALVLAGLALLAGSLLLVPVGWFVGLPWPWPPWLWRNRVFRWLGPALHIQPFDDTALNTKLGISFARLTQARVGGGREAGMHLYLVTGEQPAGRALAAVQGVPQTQALAAAWAILRLSWRRPRLVADGALMPADGGEGPPEAAPVDGAKAVAAAVSLRRNSKFLGTAEFWPNVIPTEHMTATSSNGVIAVAAAGWIEHHVVDQTPGPGAREVFLSHDARSWALFRAGAELNRMSCLKEAADLYEKALAIDAENIGALVSLASLRRRDSFAGAAVLAERAVRLIKKRNCLYGKRDDDDPNWYRAKIVLATIHNEWAKALEAGHDPELRRERVDYRASALDAMQDVAVSAIAAQDRLERVVGSKERIEDIARGASVRFRERWDIRQRVRSSSAKRARGSGRPRRPRFDTTDAADLYVLLETTFLPGALLLVAATAPNRNTPLPACYANDGGEREEAHPDRREVRKELGKGNQLMPGPLIDYVCKLELVSPRVVYNLACLYSLAAESRLRLTAEAEYDRADDYLDTAWESLRQGISRTPPLERRGLIDHARRDPDLIALRLERPSQFNRLLEHFSARRAQPATV